MKYFIDEKKFYLREEEKGIISLFIPLTNQVLFFNRTGRAVLENPNEWHDLAETVKSMNIKTVPFEKVFNDYAKVLCKLHANNIAKITDFPKPETNGVRIAGLFDYHWLGEFFTNNYNKGLSNGRTAESYYYNERSFFFRLEEKKQMPVVFEENGNIKAGVLFAESKRKFGGRSLNIEAAVFDEALSREECRQMLAKITDYVSDYLKGTNIKVRFEYMDATQAELAGMLAEIGFEQTLLIEKEIDGGGNLILLDKQK